LEEGGVEGGPRRKNKEGEVERVNKEKSFRWCPGKRGVTYLEKHF